MVKKNKKSEKKIIPTTEELNDETYQTILKELGADKVGKGTKKGGRPISLDWKTYVRIVQALEYGQVPEDVINTGIIKRNAFYDYKRKSPTFSNVIVSASTQTTRHFITAIAVSARHIPAHYKEIEDEHGKKKKVLVPEQKPDYANARWWLNNERDAKKRFNRAIDDETPDDGISIGAPETPEQAELLEKLLNKHHDYKKQKRKVKQLENEQSE